MNNVISSAPQQHLLAAAQQRLGDWLWQPNHTITPSGLRLLHMVLRIGWIVLRECRRDRLSLRASALTFTAVLALVPTLALGTAVLKGLGAGDQMRQAAHRFLEKMETTGATLPLPGTDHQAIPPATSSITDHLRRAVDTIFDYVDRTNFATLGAFGIAGLVLTVISLLGNIERSMNAIWQSDTNRPLGRKLIDYLALTVLLPLAINLALATETTLKTPTLFSRLQAVLPLAWLQHLLLTLLPFAVVAATFTVMYRFLPNTRVRLLPAVVGGIVGGGGWLFLQGLYVSLQIGVARYNAIYGSFASLPLFLLWIYSGWLVFLAGAEISFACQVWRGYRPHRQHLSPARMLSVAIEVMEMVLAAFADRDTATLRQMDDRLGIGEQNLRSVLDRLAAADLIRPTLHNGMEAYLPATPADRLRADELVVVCWGDPAPDIHPWAQEALTAARNATTGHRFGDTAPPPRQASLF